MVGYPSSVRGASAGTGTDGLGLRDTDLGGDGGCAGRPHPRRQEGGEGAGAKAASRDPFESARSLTPEELYDLLGG